MPKKVASLILFGTDKQHQVMLTNLHYLGHGAYTSTIKIASNGFYCEQEFGFDNDEYFINKLQEVLTHRSGEAQLMGLQSESYLKIQPFGQDTLLISGLILQEQPLAQSLEFAFTIQYPLLDRFVTEFARMVRANT